MAKNCQKCGAPLRDGARYCSKCGAEVIRDGGVPWGMISAVMAIAMLLILIAFAVNPEGTPEAIPKRDANAYHMVITEAQFGDLTGTQAIERYLKGEGGAAEATAEAEVWGSAVEQDIIRAERIQPGNATSQKFLTGLLATLHQRSGAYQDAINAISAKNREALQTALARFQSSVSGLETSAKMLPR